MPGVNELIELQNVFKNQTPSSPVWFEVIDHVVGVLLAAELERAENSLTTAEPSGGER